MGGLFRKRQPPGPDPQASLALYQRVARLLAPRIVRCFGPFPPNKLEFFLTLGCIYGYHFYGCVGMGSGPPSDAIQYMERMAPPLLAWNPQSLPELMLLYKTVEEVAPLIQVSPNLFRMRVGGWMLKGLERADGGGLSLALAGPVLQVGIDTLKARIDWNVSDSELEARIEEVWHNFKPAGAGGDWFTATCEGDVSQVRTLLGQGEDVNQVSAKGRTALCLVAYGGLTDVVQLLLDRGAQPDKADEGGLTPLAVSAGEGHLAIVQALLKAGATVDFRDSKAMTPLMYAVLGDRIEVVRVLLEAGADANACDQGGISAFITACDRHPDLVEAMLAHGADVKQADHEGGTPLMGLAAQGHAELVRAALARGADVNAADKTGWTALMSAAAQGHAPVVNVLLAAGANRQARNAEGRSAADMASGHPPVLQALKYGIQPN